MTRQYTRKLCDMIDNGLLTESMVVNACLSYMSESDVQDMMESNDWLDDEDSDDEDEEE